MTRSDRPALGWIGLGPLVAELEDDLLNAGHGDDDMSALARWFSLHG